MLGRLASLHILTGFAHQIAQALYIGLTMFSHKGGERGIVSQHCIAQLFHGVKACVLRVGFALECGQFGAHGCYVAFLFIAHQAAHVLQLAALAFMVCDFAGLTRGGHEPLAHGQLTELGLWQCHQRGTQGLQRSHLLFAASLGQRFNQAIVFWCFSCGKWCACHAPYDIAMNTIFSFDQAQLAQVAQDALKIARDLGCAQAAVEVSEGSGLSVGVRKGAVDTLEHNRDKGISLTVYVGQQGAFARGSASTSDFSANALAQSVRAAYDIARFTAPDDCAGLPEPELLERTPRDLQLFKPWNISSDQAIQTALRMERAAFATDKHIKNMDGCGVYVSHGQFVLANSHGFCAGYPYSRHSLSVAPIAHLGEQMQRDDWYVSQRDPAQLASPEAVGRYAAQRTLARLGARKLTTRKCPVLFEAPLAAGLVGAFTQASSGSALYRESSFLLNQLGNTIFAPHIDIVEEPHEPGSTGSSPFDDEGVRTQARQVVQGGVLQGYFLGSYSARKLKMQTTGNAGGSHNLYFKSRDTHTEDDFAGMLRKLGTGLLVTELLGQGVNYLTGDYSRGAAGFWVENGQIAYPVEEITIAGNLQQMFKGIAAVGADILRRGTKVTGSILIDEMTVAGS
jgi:PmbA protein